MTHDSRRTAEELARREFDVWNGEADVADVYAADAVYHDGFGRRHDRDTLVDYVANTRETFPDFRVRPERVLVDGDTAASRYSIGGTMAGTFHGFEPTGESFEIHGFVSHRIADGAIVETWNAVNALSMAEQLGLLDG
jgi:steroid delta-isomerase-like uncharacterized protein